MEKSKISSRSVATTRAGASTKGATSITSFVPKRVKKMTRPEVTRVISICNQKGGCGKTSTIINVAASLAMLGQRVLVVDLDAQCNATNGLGVDASQLDKTIFELLVDPKNTSIEDVVVETSFENLHLAPSSILLSEFESRVATEIGRENRLKKALAAVCGFYDFILIDTPPSLGLLSVNALNAATEVHIAMQAHPFAFDGLQHLLETITLIQEELNPRLKVTGVVITMFDPRTRISREIVEKVTAIPELSFAVFKSHIRQNVKIAEASKMRKPVMYYDSSCTGAQDYFALSVEVCKQHVSSVIKTENQKSKSV